MINDIQKTAEGKMQRSREVLKDKEISEDEARRGEEAVQKLTDKYIAEADKLLAAKEEDLMAI